MKTRTLPFLPFLLLFTAPVFSQDYTFKVLVNKGNNEYRSDGASWQPLKTGTSLKAADELKLADNAYIGLVHVDGKPIELKKSGNYKVSPDLTSLVAGGSTVLKKYVDFALSNNSAEAKKNRLSATGAVQRTVEHSAIRLVLPPSQNAGIFNNVAIINWGSTSVKGPYTVTFRSMFDDVLKQVETPEMSITVNLAEEPFASEYAVLVEVSAKADPALISEQHLIKRLAPALQEAVRQKLDEIVVELEAESALNKLILAGFYEENDLLIDAITSYEEAIRLAPDVAEFKEAYDGFLVRHAMAY